MEKKIGELRDLKVGKYVLVDGEPCRVTSAASFHTGKHGGGKIKATAVGLFNSQQKNLMGPPNTKVEIPVIYKKTAQVLSIIKDSVQLMDMSSYETFELPIPDDLKGDLSEGVSVLYMDAGEKKKILQIQ